MTAGPWRLEGPSPNNIYRIKDGSEKTLVLTELSDDTRLTDLRLIAAAPELLEACKAIVACIVDCETCNATGIEIGTKADACWSCGGVGQVLGGDDIFAAFDAREAIAKAEGR